MAKPKKHFVGLLPAGEANDVDDDIALEEEGPAERQLDSLVKDEPIPKEQPVKEISPIEKPAKQTKKAAAAEPTEPLPDEREQLRKENEELKLQQARWNERVAYAKEIAAQSQATRAQEEQVRQQQEAQKQREAERPDPLIDPTGARVWDLEQRLTQQQTWIENSQRTSQQAQVQTQEQQVWSDLDMKMNLAKTRYTDYDQAIAHLRNWREQQLVAVGIVDPDERNRIIQQEVFYYAANARVRGIDIAEFLYNQAKANGFAQVQPQPKAAAKIDQLNRGRQLAGLGGQRPGVTDREEEFDLGAWLETASESDVIAMQHKMGVSKFNQMLERLEMGPMQ